MRKRSLGLHNIWLLPLLLIFLNGIKDKLAPSITDLNLSVIVISIYIILSVSEYIYLYTKYNLPLLRGERMPDNSLLPRLSSIASRLGVPLHRIYFVKTEEHDNSESEAVYHKDGTLLIRHKLIELIKSSEMAANIDNCNIFKNGLHYTQDVLEYVCACEMAKLVLMHRDRSLFVAYFASLLVIIPCVLLLIHPYDRVTIDIRMIVFLFGLFLLMVDSLWLVKRRDRQVDMLTISATGNAVAASVAVLKPWLLDSKSISTDDRNLSRYEYLRLLSFVNNSDNTSGFDNGG